jgi:hypothetical protein
VNCPFCAAIVRPIYLELRANSEQIATLKDDIAALRPEIRSGTAVPAASPPDEPKPARALAVLGAMFCAFAGTVLAYYLVIGAGPCCSPGKRVQSDHRAQGRWTRPFGLLTRGLRAFAPLWPSDGQKVAIGAPRNGPDRIFAGRPMGGTSARC